MADDDPTVVAVYELVAGAALRVAEFRLDRSGSMQLILAEPDGCPLAREWFQEGIRVPGQTEPVRATDGPLFLRAALRPRQMSFCRVVDESPDTTDPQDAAPPSADRAGCSDPWHPSP